MSNANAFIMEKARMGKEAKRVKLAALIC